MRRLVWAFAGCKYHIVVHLMSWLKYIRIIIIVTWSDLLYHVDWNVSGDLTVWSRLLDVIQYARSSYCYDNIFIIYPFPTLFWLYKVFWSLIQKQCGNVCLYVSFLDVTLSCFQSLFSCLKFNLRNATRKTGSSCYTTLTNFCMIYLVMCKVYTDEGGIK